MPCQLSRSNKGWHAQWFYLKNDPATPLLVFTGCLIEEAPPTWLWGPPVKEKKRMRDILEAVADHARRVMPLMVRVLPLYGMMPSAQLIGTMLA